uniref:J domain-containing protein n=1 Tax=Magallana gigas TaxID=29159 RepID=A0A8W8IQR3_MAGGI
MGFSRSEAYDVLELPIGADQDSVRTSYKRLALKWHPDKHGNSTESMRKFQEISKAYKKLMEDDGEDGLRGMTLDQMMQLFKDVFFSRTSSKYCFIYCNPCLLSSRQRQSFAMKGKYRSVKCCLTKRLPCKNIIALCFTDSIQNVVLIYQLCIFAKGYGLNFCLNAWTSLKK